MSFGFSVGDLISAAGVTYRLIKALHGSQDAGEEYRAAITELGSFQQALMKVSCLRSNKDVPYATSECASTIVMGCMDIIQAFLERTKKYDRRLGTLRSPGFALANGMRKMGWALFKAEDMKKLRDTLHARLTALTVLLAAANLEIQGDAAEAKVYLDAADGDFLRSSELTLRESTERDSVRSQSSKDDGTRSPEPLSTSSTNTQSGAMAERSRGEDLSKNTTSSRIQADDSVAREALLDPSSTTNSPPAATPSQVDLVTREASSSFLLSVYTPDELRSIILDLSKRADCVKEISKLLKSFVSMGESRLTSTQQESLLALLEILCTEPPQDGFPSRLPIRFKDAVGRKFSFPWSLCKTWKGMEELIKQAFLHVDVVGPHVHQGHYDLLGPDGQIILPQVWETIVQPDWSITMHMWPMPERPPPPPPPPQDLPSGKTPKSKKKKKSGVVPDVETMSPSTPHVLPRKGSGPAPLDLPEPADLDTSDKHVVVGSSNHDSILDGRSSTTNPVKRKQDREQFTTSTDLIAELSDTEILPPLHGLPDGGWHLDAKKNSLNDDLSFDFGGEAEKMEDEHLEYA